MFYIEISKDGKPWGRMEASKFVLLAQNSGESIKSFSSPDLIEQLGLLEFAKVQVQEEVKQLSVRREVGSNAKI